MADYERRISELEAQSNAMNECLEYMETIESKSKLIAQKGKTIRDLSNDISDFFNKDLPSGPAKKLGTLDRIFAGLDFTSTAGAMEKALEDMEKNQVPSSIAMLRSGLPMWGKTAFTGIQEMITGETYRTAPKTTYADLLQKRGMEKGFASEALGFGLDIGLDPGFWLKAPAAITGKLTKWSETGIEWARTKIPAVDKGLSVLSEEIGKRFDIFHEIKKLPDELQVGAVMKRIDLGEGLKAWAPEQINKTVKQYFMDVFKTDFSKSEIVEAVRNIGSYVQRPGFMPFSLKEYQEGGRLMKKYGDEPTAGFEKIYASIANSIGAASSKKWGVFEDAVKFYDEGVAKFRAKMGSINKEMMDVAGSEGAEGLMVGLLKQAEELQKYMPAINKAKITLERSFAQILARGGEMSDDMMARFKHLAPIEPAGIDLVNPKSPIFGKDFRVPKAIADMVDNVLIPGPASTRTMTSALDWLSPTKLAGIKDFRTEFLGIYDDITGFMRVATTVAFPKWWTRNVTAGAHQNFLQGTGISDVVDSIKIQLDKFKGTIGGLTGEDIAAAARKRGIYSQSGQSEIRQFGDDNILATAIGWVERQIRLPGFIHELKKGANVDEAAELVRKYQFNYDAKLNTIFEKEIFGRLAFFPNYVKGLFKFFGDPEAQVRVMQRHQATAKLYEAGQTENDFQWKPPWVREKITFWEWSGLGTMFEDAIGWVAHPVKQFEQNVALPLRNIAELISDYNTFTEGKISEDTAARKWKNAPGFMKWAVGYEEDPYTGKATVAPYMRYFAEMFGNRSLSTGLEANDQSKAVTQRVWEYLTSIKPYTMDSYKQQQVQSIEAKKLEAGVINLPTMGTPQYEAVAKQLPGTGVGIGNFYDTSELSDIMRKAYGPQLEALSKRAGVPTEQLPFAQKFPFPEARVQQDLVKSQTDLRMEIEKLRQVLTTPEAAREAKYNEKRLKLRMPYFMGGEKSQYDAGMAEIDRQEQVEKKYYERDEAGRYTYPKPPELPSFPELIARPNRIPANAIEEDKLKEQAEQLVYKYYAGVMDLLPTTLGTIEMKLQGQIMVLRNAIKKMPAKDAEGFEAKALGNLQKVYGVLMQEMTLKMENDYAKMMVDFIQRMPEGRERTRMLLDWEKESYQSSEKYRRANPEQQKGMDQQFGYMAWVRTTDADTKLLIKEADAMKEIMESQMKGALQMIDQGLDTGSTSINDWQKLSKAQILDFIKKVVAMYEQLLANLPKVKQQVGIDPDTSEPIFKEIVHPQFQEQALQVQKTIENLKQSAASLSFGIDQKSVSMINQSKNTMIDLMKFFAANAPSGFGAFETDTMGKQLEAQNLATVAKYEEQFEKIRQMKAESDEDMWNQGEMIASLRAAKEAEIVANGEKAKVASYQMTLTAMGQFAGMGANVMETMYNLTGKKHRELMYAAKGFMIAEATMKGALAAVDAYRAGCALPPPFGGPWMGAAFAAMAIAATSAQIAKITATPMAEGGPIVGGTGTRDDVPIMAMGGEYVMSRPSVERYGMDFMHAVNTQMLDAASFTVPSMDTSVPKLSYASGGAVSIPDVKVPDSKQSLTILNYVDKNMVLEALATPEGSNAVINVLGSRADEVKRTIG